MAKRHDILTTRKYITRDGEEKTAYTKIGTMWPLDNGGFSLTFDALPVPTLYDGKLEVRAVAFEPKPKGGNQGGGDYDDDPFAGDR